MCSVPYIQVWRIHALPLPLAICSPFPKPGSCLVLDTYANLHNLDLDPAYDQD